MRMTIKSIDDVKNFFQYLYTERKVAFHPDDEFSVYVNNDSKKPTFTPEECEEFDAAMSKCFAICDACDMDIYELATEIRDELK